MAYKGSATIDATLTNLVNSFGPLCQKIDIGASVFNRRVTGVKIANASGGERPAVLFTGGIHAREWAPPDALLNFVDKLVRAFAAGGAVTYPAFTDSTGVLYGQYEIPASVVANIVSRFDLYVVPAVNPDGRDFSLGVGNVQKMWRKNRRPRPGPLLGDLCDGVDINRNFPIAWDPDIYYTPIGAAPVKGTALVCGETYRGPFPGSEPETQNLISFIANTTITYFVDVHAFGRTMMYPWGMETDQTADLSQSFLNPLWNRSVFGGGRDGPLGGSYAEFVPDDATQARGRLLARLRSLAFAAVAEIARSAGLDPRAIARSAYLPQQSVGLYPTTGAFDDYTFGQQFWQPWLPNIHAFTLECGHEGGHNPLDPDDDDGGFWPNFTTQFPKVEREVHAGLVGFLQAI